MHENVQLDSHLNNGKIEIESMFVKASDPRNTDLLVT